LQLQQLAELERIAAMAEILSPASSSSSFWYSCNILVTLIVGVVYHELVVLGDAQQQALLLASQQVNALLQLQELLEYPSATRNWNNNTNFCDLTSNPSLNLTCAAGGTLTYLRIVGDKQYVPLGDRLLLLHSITDEPAAAPLSNNNKSLSSDFNFSALIGTLLSFPDLQGIELVSVGLWGSLPAAELNQLSNLQVLNASSNLISGSVPQSLAGLGALRVLALDANAFTGSFPFWLSSVPSLQVLSLSDNQLSGGLQLNDSSNIAHFHQSTQQQLTGKSSFMSSSHSSLEGTTTVVVPPSSITLLQNLVSLSLAHNQFTGLIPNFDSLVHLQSLNLGGNSFGPEFPSLGNKLVSVYLGENQLAGPIPSSLKSLTELQTLDLSGNALSGNPPQFLFELPSIVFLSLARNHLSGILPDNLSLGPFLTFLDVSSNDLSGPLPKAFLSSVNNVTIKYQNNCLATIKQQQETALYCSSATVAAAAAETGSHGHRRLAIIAAILGGGIGIGLIICVLSILLLKRWTTSSDEEDNNIVAPEDGCNSSSFASPIGIPSELLINASKRFCFSPTQSQSSCNHANSFFFLEYPISPESSSSPSCRKEDENNVISLSLSLNSFFVYNRIHCTIQETRIASSTKSNLHSRGAQRSNQ
jgi:Leucine-rich repeat (LRR) protein